MPSEYTSNMSNMDTLLVIGAGGEGLPNLHNTHTQTYTHTHSAVIIFDDESEYSEPNHPCKTGYKPLHDHASAPVHTYRMEGLGGLSAGVITHVPKG